MVRNATSSGGGVEKITPRDDSAIAPQGADALATESRYYFDSAKEYEWSFWQYMLHPKKYQAAWNEYQQARKQNAEDASADVQRYFDLVGRETLKVANVPLSLGFVNAQGGVGKTTLSCYTASTLAEVARRQTVLFDHNPMMGVCDLLLGLSDRNGLTIRRAYRDACEGKLNKAGLFTQRLSGTKHGVKLVGADRVVQHEEFYSQDMAKAVVALGVDHAELLVHDTGNGVQTPGMSGLLESLNVMGVPTAMNRKSIRLTINTLQSLHEWGYGDLVERAIVVVMGLRPGETLEMYRELYNEEASEMRKKHDVYDLSDTNTLLAVPFDQSIVAFDEIDLDQTDFYVQLAFREVALAALLLAQQSEWSKHDPALASGQEQGYASGQLIKLPSGRNPVLPWTSASSRLAS